MAKFENRAKRIVQQLGMSLGTAQHRLRKNILFSFAKRLKEDVCFKCGKQIEKVEELSIEHKQPWENRSVELYWDLTNIAFSHLACNRQHTNGTEKLRKVGPEGTSWCSSHQEFLPIDRFWKNPNNWSGVARQCAECMTKTDRRANHASYVKKDLRASSVMVASPSPKR
jgi:hypothetical protein